eukprot:3828848-Karenia_brevis.AAC.1
MQRHAVSSRSSLSQHSSSKRQEARPDGCIQQFCKGKQDPLTVLLGLSSVRTKYLNTKHPS